jgi:hypothetical protein
MTAQGANSSFLRDIIARAALASGSSYEDFYRATPNSLCLSMDLAQAMNPAYADKYDETFSPLLGKGPALKINVNQRYATDRHPLAEVHGQGRFPAGDHHRPYVFLPLGREDYGRRPAPSLDARSKGDFGLSRSGRRGGPRQSLLRVAGRTLSSGFKAVHRPGSARSPLFADFGI